MHITYKILRSAVLIVSIFMMFTSCKNAPSKDDSLAMQPAIAKPKESPVANDQPTDNISSTRLVKQDIASDFITLKLDATVSMPSSNTIKLYKTNSHKVDIDLWLDQLWSDKKQNAVHLFDTFNQKTLDANHVTLADKKTEFAYTVGNDTVWYDSHSGRLFATFIGEKSLHTNWHDASEGQQARGVQMTPVQAAQEAMLFVDNLKLSGLVLANVYAMPADIEDPTTFSYYNVELKRIVDGIPCAYDDIPQMGAGLDEIQLFGDKLLISIHDDGILYVDGYYREISQESVSELSLTLEDATSLLQKNMDYVYAYNPQSIFTISQIEMVYVPIQLLPSDDVDVSSIIELRPAWRFASGIGRGTTDTYIMWIDALHGDVFR